MSIIQSLQERPHDSHAAMQRGDGATVESGKKFCVAARVASFLRSRLPSGARTKTVQRLLRISDRRARQLITGTYGPTLAHVEEMAAAFGADFVRQVFDEIDHKLTELETEIARLRKENDALLLDLARRPGGEAAADGGKARYRRGPPPAPVGRPPRLLARLGRAVKDAGLRLVRA